MSEKLNTIVSPEAQKAWTDAQTLEAKVAVVKKFEDLRHLFAQALDIWNQLPDEPAQIVVNPPSK